MTISIACEQAIFTSIRTPTGEGYRIIAASRGIRPEERQTITRFSPSHDALCHTDGGAEPLGVAFFPLPTERLCVAYSCLAGAEHTGRGGQRVYTYNLLFSKEAFADCRFNPFAMLRAMCRAGLNEPQLHPPAVLPEVSLEVSDSDLSPDGAELCSAFGAAWRDHCLDSLLRARTLVVNLPDRWIETMEALLLGVPGPMRNRFSFGAGLKFSVGRCHNLSLLADDQSSTKKKLLGRPIAYIDPADGVAPDRVASAWVTFVERHWSKGELVRLAPRTSLPFSDTTPEALERIGRLYNETDTMAEKDTEALLALAGRHIGGPDEGVEGELTAALLAKMQTAIAGRYRTATWPVLQHDWPVLTEFWKRGDAGRAFVLPMIDAGLRAAAVGDPAAAAEAVATLVGTLPKGTQPDGLESLVSEVLNRLAAWTAHLPENQISRVGTLIERWKRLRPGHPSLAIVEQRCAAASGQWR